MSASIHQFPTRLRALPGTMPNERPHLELMRQEYRRNAIDLGATAIEADEYASSELAKWGGDAA